MAVAPPLPGAAAVPGGGGGTVSFVTGEVLASRRDSCTGNSSRTCLVSVVGLKDGRTAGLEFSDGPGAPRLAAGDRVRLARTTDPQTGGPAYVYDDQVRDVPLGLLSLAFAVVVVGVARWRGLAALVGLGVAYGVLVLFLVPALLAGDSALAVGLVAGAAIDHAQRMEQLDGDDRRGQAGGEPEFQR